MTEMPIITSKAEFLDAIVRIHQYIKSQADDLIIDFHPSPSAKLKEQDEFINEAAAYLVSSCGYGSEDNDALGVRTDGNALFVARVLMYLLPRARKRLNYKNKIPTQQQRSSSTT